MVRIARAIACAVVLASPICVLHGQTISAEADITAGYSGEEVRAAASQLRVFGDGPAKIRYFAEASWAGRWAGDDEVIGGGLIGVDPIGTDVFGAAYPYRRRLQVMGNFARRSASIRGATTDTPALFARRSSGMTAISRYPTTGSSRAR
jgi:hypothetical protein